MLSAMLVHRTSVAAIVDRCAANASPVIAGGPLFTTCHAAFPRIPHFVLGEAEDVLPQLVDDMQAGTVRPSYEAPGRPDLTRLPPPRWDLIDPQDYVTMAVQFSRGCPYDCELCDITIMSRVPQDTERAPRSRGSGEHAPALGTSRDGWLHRRLR
jgi:radical SAM superfamily enzyme YgiQ (UPF0313 family)